MAARTDGEHDAHVRQPWHPDRQWRVLADISVSHSVTPRRCHRLFDFSNVGVASQQPPPTPGDASTAPIYYSASIMTLRHSPDDWAALAACSSGYEPGTTSSHSGLDPQRPWGFSDERQAFFLRLAKNSVTRTSSFVDDAEPSTSDPVKTEALHRPWQGLARSVAFGSAASADCPPLSPAHLTHLGQQALLPHLQRLWASAQRPIDFLLTSPADKRVMLVPRIIALDWARPSLPRLINTNSRIDTVFQLDLRPSLVPVLNALLRETLIGRAASRTGQEPAATDDVGELFWVLKTEVASFLPDKNPQNVLMRSRPNRKAEVVSLASEADPHTFAGDGGSRGEKSFRDDGSQHSASSGLADFYLMYRPSKAVPLRIAAVLELKPHLQLGFLAHALLCCLGDAAQADVRPARCFKPGTELRPGHSKAQHLVHQLLGQMSTSAAPLSLLLTTFQILAIERKDADAAAPLGPAPLDHEMLDLVVHDVAYASPLPKSLKRTPEVTEGAEGRCHADKGVPPLAFSVNNDENLTARLLSLSLRAAERCDAPAQQHPDQRFSPFWPSMRGGRIRGAEHDVEVKAPQEPREGGGGGAAGAAGDAEGATEQQGHAGTAEADRQAPVVEFRTQYFARGAYATTHAACITDSGPGCLWLARPHGIEQCKRLAGHKRCVVKIARGLFEAADDSAKLDGLHNRSEAQLRKEADTYRSLRSLQGSVIPTFLGIFANTIAQESAAYAYEDAGFSLQDGELFHALRLSKADVEEIRRAVPELLHRLHREGFAHRDVALRNFCVTRRATAACPGHHAVPSHSSSDSPAPTPSFPEPSDATESRHSTLQVRLIDLGAAYKLSNLSQAQAEALVRQDLVRAQEVVEDFRELAGVFL